MIAGQEVPATDATSPSATAGRADADDTQVAATEIAETAASPTSADIQPPPVASEQVLQLSPSRGDIPKLLNPAQVFQSPTQTNVSQQVIGATDENGRFFLFSTPGAGDQAQQQQQPTPMPMPMPMPQPVSADDMVGRTAVPSIIPGVQFAQAQTGGQFYLMVPASSQPGTQETTVTASGAAAQAHRAIAPRGGEIGNVSVTMKAPSVSKNMRDDRRRSTHNEVERRRRDKINAWITELTKLIPDCQEDTSKQGQSKGGVLAKTVDYVQELQSNNTRMLQMLQDHEQVMMEKQMLKARLSDLEKENTILKNKLGEMGVEIITQPQTVTTMEVISTSEQA
eukprot:m.12467 g.12467  ORF g.12467 m.12467 type:complete len:339 (+) comp24090_c0_seq2:92-1108(+)